MIGLRRAEGAALGLLAMLGYHLSGGGWWLFAALFLVPDLSFAGYLAGPVIGARVYNAAHSWIGPALALAVAALSSNATALELALIWAAHVGIDRGLGYGLKLDSGFQDTHLGRIGRR